MNFPEIVKELNRRIRESDSILNNLQPERAAKKGLKRVSNKFFNDREDLLDLGYTFHYGGGDEFQFNIDYNNYDSPLDLELRFAAYKKEPMNFAPDEDEKLDVSGFEIASFSSEYLELSLYDGTYYYIIELETDTGTMQSIGVENIRDMLVEVAESLE